VFGYSQNLTVFHHCLAFIKKDQNQKKTHGGVAVLFFVAKFHTTTTKKKKKGRFCRKCFLKKLKNSSKRSKIYLPRENSDF
jgi:hypothetical protein